MQDWYRKLVLNYNRDHGSNDFSNEQRISKSGSRPDSKMYLGSQDYQDQSEWLYLDEETDSGQDLADNPFFVNQNSRFGLKRLFVGPDLDDSYFIESQNYFNSDTKIEFLGGLALWQLTAIIIGVLIAFSLVICLVKKLRKTIRNSRRHIGASSVNTSNVSSHSSIRTSYASSTGSTSQLVAKSVTFSPNRLIESIPSSSADKYKAVPNFV